MQTTSSGQPGSGSSIIIRGFGSINASNDPLYVVDGAPFDGALNSINPADIESMTILKDASGNDILDAFGNQQLDYGDTRPKQTNFSCVGTQLDDYNGTVRDNVGVRTFIALGSDSDDAGWMKGLKLTANFSADYSSSNGTTFYNLYHGNAQAAHGRLTKSNSRMLSYTFNQLLTWNRSFGLHNVDVLAGHEFYSLSWPNAGNTGALVVIAQ